MPFPTYDMGIKRHGMLETKILKFQDSSHCVSGKMNNMSNFKLLQQVCRSCDFNAETRSVI